MSASRIPVEEFTDHAEEYVRRAERGGECFTITRAGNPVAVLAPVLGGVRITDPPALVAALPHLAASDAEPFAAAPPAVRTGRNREPGDPWAR